MTKEEAVARALLAISEHEQDAFEERQFCTDLGWQRRVQIENGMVDVNWGVSFTLEELSTVEIGADDVRLQGCHEIHVDDGSLDNVLCSKGRGGKADAQR